MTAFNQTTDAYPSEAFLGYGGSLWVGDVTSPHIYAKIAEVTKITPGAMTTAAADRTHLQSPEAHREKIPGIRDTGPFGIEGNWLPTDPTQSNDAGGSPQTGGLVYLARTRAIRSWKILLNDPAGTEWPFRGFISSFQPGEISIENIAKFTAEITPTQDVSADLP